MLAFILNGSTRVMIYNYLLSGPSYSYKIVKDLKLNTTSISRSLRDMKEAGVIECITPCQQRKKFYTLTNVALYLKDDVLAHLQSSL
ncbi:MAG: ArsR family transcriptional regulator [Candidatus Hodarchaeales archaeon]|jgi:predicted transcriptional regulator